MSDPTWVSVEQGTRASGSPRAAPQQKRRVLENNLSFEGLSLSPPPPTDFPWRLESRDPFAQSDGISIYMNQRSFLSFEEKQEEEREN